MLYMKEMRANVVAECTLKESAAINQILGRRVGQIVGVPRHRLAHTRSNSSLLIVLTHQEIKSLKRLHGLSFQAQLKKKEHKGSSLYQHAVFYELVMIIVIMIAPANYVALSNTDAGCPSN